VLSHRSAAALWGFRPTNRVRTDVTAPRSRKGPSDLDVHRSRRLADEEVTIHDGIPVTTVARTLVDLADLLPLDALSRALHEAEVLRLLDVAAIERSMNGRRGVPKLRAILTDPGHHTRSELESRFAALCHRERLPLPRLNAFVRIGDQLREVDALWPRHRVIAELDGAAVHLTRRAFETDRAKDLTLAAEGYLVVRITWRQLTRESHLIADGLRRLLATR
jgi:very-short-patch-repair endonuclease